MLNTFEDSTILQRLRVENPWWTTQSVDAHYRSMQSRMHLDAFYAALTNTSIHRAVVLMGPRRVGKTVMLYHAIQRLIDSGVSPQRIAYVSLDTPVLGGIGLEQLRTYCYRAVGLDLTDKETFYLFFDEVQYFEHWEQHLKSLVDSYRHLRIAVSGSAAAALRMQSNESGAGRFRDMELPALTFYEYLHLNEQSHILTQDEDGNVSTLDIQQLNTRFIDYINYGGYPEVALQSELQDRLSVYVKAGIVDKVLLRDLPSLYGIADTQELKRFFNALAFQTGNELNYDKLSGDFGTSKATIKKYLTYLEAAFLIRILHRVDASGRRFKRVNTFKCYLTNPSLRAALFAPIQAYEDGFGQVVETAILGQYATTRLDSTYYARWKGGEVDLTTLHRGKLTPESALEIKWSNAFYHKPEKLKSLARYMMQHQLPEATVTTIDEAGSKTTDGGVVRFVPAALYALRLGKAHFDTL